MLEFSREQEHLFAKSMNISIFLNEKIINEQAP